MDSHGWGRRVTWVVANLFSTILQKAFPRIITAMKQNAVLVISGILASQWEETKAAAERRGLTFDKVIKRGKWVTAKGGLSASTARV